MDYNALMKLMAEKRTDIGTRYAEMPNIEAKTRESLFGNDPVLNNLRTNETSKIQELYSHDKVLADQYANPQSQSYMADPYSREKARAIHFGKTAGELSDIQGNTSKRQDVLGNALEKAMKLLNYGLEASKLEYSGMQDEFDNKMKLDDFALRKSESGKKGASAQDKRGQDATDKVISGLGETLANAKPGEDKKKLAWDYIHEFEPLFNSQGVDSAMVWDAYNRIPGGGQASAPTPNSSGANYLQMALPALKQGGAVMQKSMGVGSPSPIDVPSMLMSLLKGGK